MPVFRTGVTLVPLDVRIVDKDGRPVTDLKADDFTILEDGVAQPLGHFSTHAYTPEPATAPLDSRPRRASDAMELGTKNRRIFLLVLGRGRLTGPSEGMDAMRHLVDARLLPQDLVSVLAWNRATDFTTDRTVITDVIARFKRDHIGIELAIQDYNKSLAARYDDGRLPARIQKQIDDVFGGLETGAMRTMDGSNATTEKLSDQIRRTSDRMLGGDNPGNKLDPIDQAEVDRLGGTLDEFLTASTATLDDITNLYLGVEYLRQLAGEKHLIFLSEYGIAPPSLETDRGIARRAADARVALSIIHTGGVPYAGRGSSQTPFTIGANVITSGQVARTITKGTGGQFFAHRFKNASMDIDLIDQGARFLYSLGYYPQRPIGDGMYRKVSVRVNRPGLTVLARDGYFAKRELVPFARKEMMTFTRVAAAAGHARPIPDIGIRETLATSEGRGNAAPIRIRTTIDLSRVVFDRTNGLNTAQVEVAAFAVTSGHKTVGEVWQTLELSYTDARLEAVRRDGLRHEMLLPSTAPAADVKIVAYNYNADLLGSVVAKVQR